MKIKYFLLAAFALPFLSSCGSDPDNADYVDLLKDKYNTELKWDPDSMAFMRANWEDQEIGDGIAIRQASGIKMWNTMQSVTLATYAQDALVTGFAQAGQLTKTSDQALEGGGVIALNGSFFDASGKPATFIMIDKEVKGTQVNPDANGLIAINDTGDSWTLEIRPFAESDIEGIKHDYTSALAAGPLLVYNDEIQSFPNTDYYTSLQARSIIGLNRSGQIVMAVIDGGIEGKAEGVSVPHAAVMAQLMGMRDAVCLAGGTSSTLWHTGKGVLNYPSGNAQLDHEGESPVSNIILAKKFTMFAGGDGSQANPYLIATGSQMKNIRNTMNQSDQAVYFKMTRDVDMSGVDWTPWNAAAPYKNKIDFDGDGHTIRNFTCEGGGYPSFAGVLNGSIKNVNFVDAKVIGTSTDSHTGIVAGYLGTTGIFGEIENVSVQGTVEVRKNDVFVGGLVGNQRYGTIKNCYVKADVVSQTAGDRGVGGIVGYQYDNRNLKTPTDEVNTLIMNSYFEGSVRAACCVGGILGKSENRYGNYVYGNISNASSLTGDVVGTVAGRAFQACMEEKKTIHDNYGSRDAVLSTPLDINGAFYNNTSTNVYYGAPFSGTASATARAAGWDEQLWDLSGDTPRLKSFE